MFPSSEKAIDAKVEELDMLIGELQKRRQELVEAKDTMKAAVAYEKKKEERLPAETIAPPLKRATPVSPRPASSPTRRLLLLRRRWMCYRVL